jgi:hypothetical protein
MDHVDDRSAAARAGGHLRVSDLPVGARDVLERATLCYVGVSTSNGPHVTPVVFAWSGGRVWTTTSRRSLKSRVWSSDDRVAGLTRHADRAVAFAGRIRAYDALSPETWIGSALAAPSLAAATLRFGRKNARFFAGYALDARSVPLAWTPPGRVFAGLDIARGAFWTGSELRSSWGDWAPSRVTSRRAFRARVRGGDPFAALPRDVAARLGRHHREAAIGVDGPGGPSVLPAAWVANAGDLYAALPTPVARLAGAGLEGRVALSVDRASEWRARDMVGAMVQGDGAPFTLDELASGRASAARLVQAAGVDPAEAVLVRIAPRRLVWWRGWAVGAIVLGRSRTREPARPGA